MKYLILLPLLLVASSASAGFKVKLDCYFVAGPVNCQTLRDSFFSSMPYLVQSDMAATDSNLTITLRSFEMDRRYRYVIELSETETVSALKLIELNILKSFSGDGATQILLGDLQKLMGPHLKVTSVGSTVNGITTISVTDPRSSGLPGETTNTTPWYLNLYVSGNMSAGTNTSISGNAGALLNFSTPNWRFNASTNGYYQHVKVTLPDGSSESDEVTSFGGRILIVRSFLKKWSVAAIAAPIHDPRNNLSFEGRATAGLEWDLVPFLATNDHSLGINYTTSFLFQNYKQDNVLGKSQMSFIEHALTAFVTWHFDRVDVSSNISARSKIDDLNFSAASVGGDIGWRVTNNFSISAYVNASYRHALINQPGANMITDAFQQSISGGNYAQFTWNSGLTLSYTLGNAGLNTQDQRWRN